MPCDCKCCCGCCCDGENGSQTLQSACEAPKEFKGKGTICDVCCDLGEIREDIDSEEDCPGTWVANGRCKENPCGCSGPCDEENPCPEGCECVDGECVEVCPGQTVCWRQDSSGCTPYCFTGECPTGELDGDPNLIGFESLEGCCGGVEVCIEDGQRLLAALAGNPLP